MDNASDYLPNHVPSEFLAFVSPFKGFAETSPTGLSGSQFNVPMGHGLPLSIWPMRRAAVAFAVAHPSGYAPLAQRRQIQQATRLRAHIPFAHVCQHHLAAGYGVRLVVFRAAPFAAVLGPVEPHEPTYSFQSFG